jgi:trehalose 6-phosphate phosphatase
MQYILSKTSRPIVTRLAHERTLCAFDFDGTLSSIVDHPDLAVMRAGTENLLRRLALLYPCLIVSGRARADLLRRMSGVHVAQVIGNHGAETKSASRPRHPIDRWKAALEMELGPVPGLWVEDKGISLAIHYRSSVRKADARRRILVATRKLECARVFGGKRVVNVVEDGVPNKGDAVAAERDRLECSWVLYVGDDENDEDAFALGGNMIPVRIGRKLRSHARYYLRAQEEIDALLELLVRLREPVAAV